ncbi:MAG: hypoxanthine phosphoribosyltransferase [Acetilactobacillus jinshanensis]
MLLDKPDYVGFKIPNVFIVGYGTDYQQRFRNFRTSHSDCLYNAMMWLVSFYLNP